MPWGIGCLPSPRTDTLADQLESGPEALPQLLTGALRIPLTPISLYLTYAATGVTLTQ